MKIEQFNSGWKFWLEKNSFSLTWNTPDDAQCITLPHDAMLESQPHPDSPNAGSTGFRDGGNYVYIKRFYVPDDYRDRIVELKFDGIYMNSLVYVNSQLVGSRPYGYSAFTVSLSNYLKYGAENEIRVLVKNSGMPNSRWYSGGGIYREAWLLTSGPVYLPDNGIKVSTRYIESDYASLSLSTRIINRDYHVHALRLVTEIFDPSGQLAARSELPVTMLGSSEETLEQNLSVFAPQLWSAESPSLYRCVTRLLSGETELDAAETEFGIRTLQLDPHKGLRVNGETVKLRGACIHHDNGLLGAATYYDAEYRRVFLLKQAGFNAIRMAHHPASSALLRACDRLGLYVMDEAFDMWSRPKKDNDYSLHIAKWWQDDLTAMVERDFNHPSVVLYSLGNEIPEVSAVQGTSFGRKMVRLVKSLDPTRYIMVSINGVYAAGDSVDKVIADVLSAAASRGKTNGDVNDFMTAMDEYMDDIVLHPAVSQGIDNACTGMDLVGYNYMTARYAHDAETYPQRVMVGSETYPPQIAQSWALVKALPSLVGDFTWTGWDYIGEAGIGVPAYQFGEGGFGAQFPCQLAYCGDVDITGFRRPLSYYRELVFGFRTAPYIAVQRPDKYGQRLIKTPWIFSDAVSSWTYPGMEGMPVVVEVYSAGTEVELLLNGKSLGRKPAGVEAEYVSCFDIVYESGVLEAVSYLGNEIIGTYALTTAQGKCRLLAEAEPQLTSDGEGLIYVNITKLAENDVTAAHSDEILSVAGDENACILGFGSGDPKPTHSYLEQKTRTFLGRAAAIVKKIDPAKPSTFTFTGESGTACLTV